jgi:hypothetical protein
MGSQILPGRGHNGFETVAEHDRRCGSRACDCDRRVGGGLYRERTICGRFQPVRPRWPTGDTVSDGGGKLQINADATKGYWSVYQSSLFGDADICVDVSVNTVTDPNGPMAVVDFWLVDNKNYYGLYFAPNGAAAIQRFQNGKLLTPVSWRKAPSLKTDANAVNAVRVTLKGNSIATYFNDQLFYKVNGSQPEGGGQIALEGWAEKANGNIWTFTNLKITDPPQ